jgi:hypothetical protein
MTDNTDTSNVEEEPRGKVSIGFHQLGGISLDANGVRLSPQEAFILAGQLQAHATIMIQMGYAEAAMAQEAIRSGGGLNLPPGFKK